jgi:hypothetical protein
MTLPESMREAVEKLISAADLPRGQEWLTFDQLRAAAEKLDDNQKQRHIS